MGKAIGKNTGKSKGTVTGPATSAFVDKEIIANGKTFTYVSKTGISMEQRKPTHDGALYAEDPNLNPHGWRTNLLPVINDILEQKTNIAVMLYKLNLRNICIGAKVHVSLDQLASLESVMNIPDETKIWIVSTSNNVTHGLIKESHKDSQGYSRYNAIIETNNLTAPFLNGKTEEVVTFEKKAEFQNWLKQNKKALAQLMPMFQFEIQNGKIPKRFGEIKPIIKIFYETFVE